MAGSEQCGRSSKGSAVRRCRTDRPASDMPLFGKAKEKPKKEEETKVKRTPTVEDKYDLKDVLGT